MSLQRTIQTRLLEACAREAKACFSQSSLGLAPKYSQNGKFRIFPWAVIPGANVTTRQINIVVNSGRFVIGTGGVSNSEYDAAFTFLFPPETNEFIAGENAYPDEVFALQYWLISGGAVPNQNPGRLIDPDWAGDERDGRKYLTTSIKEIVHNSGYMSTPKDVTPAFKAIFVDMLITFVTQEDKTGARA